MAEGCTQAEAEARAALLDVRSYRVFLDLTAGPGHARSRTGIRFRCREPGAGTFADLSAPTVRGVVLNGERLDPGTALANGRLWLPGLAADNLLVVHAEFPYPADGHGLARFADLPDGTQYVLATCFPTAAPGIFCCFDQPDLRAGLTLSVAAPAGWECIAGGPVTSRPDPGRAGVWRFATVPAMKPYELSLCAGPYVTASEEEFRGAGGPVRLTVRCRRRLAGEPGLARIGGVVRRVLEYYERLLGVPCPYPKYDVVCTPGLGPKAMQLPALMLVSEPLLQQAGDGFGTRILAHEVAHLWFGCLVEGRWWDDLWLAEGMASYLAELAGHEALGLDAVWAEFAMNEKAAACRADQVPGVPPVASPVPTAAAGMDRPFAIAYAKAAAVVRQLAALIGDDALRAGIREFLTRYGGSSATSADLVGCWARASRRDLSEWAQQWLHTPGVNTLRPELSTAPDGTVASFAVVQQPPPPAVAGRERPVLRTHRVAVGLYDDDGGRLRRRGLAVADISGARTALPGLTGTKAPDALVVNDGDLTLARIRLDERSLRTLAARAMDVGDPVTEALCWNAAWDMTTAAELPAAEFTALAARRIGAGQPPAGLAHLLDYAVTGADYYALPTQRPGLRQRLADAALERATTMPAGSRSGRLLAAGYARSAHSASQLDLLRSWLAGPAHQKAERPQGFPAMDLELRWAVLRALSARGLVAGAEVGAAAAGDPVGGERHRAACRALRPEPAAKEEAWAAALSAGTPAAMARAYAEGIWVPGQDDILAPYRERYFAEALPAAGRRGGRDAVRLVHLLYPATLADPATVAATDAAVAGGGLSEPLRLALVEEGMTLRRVIAARELAAASG